MSSNCFWFDVEGEMVGLMDIMVLVLWFDMFISFRELMYLLNILEIIVRY